MTLISQYFFLFRCLRQSHPFVLLIAKCRFQSQKMNLAHFVARKYFTASVLLSATSLLILSIQKILSICHSLSINLSSAWNCSLTLHATVAYFGPNWQAGYNNFLRKPRPQKRSTKLRLIFCLPLLGGILYKFLVFAIVFRQQLVVKRLW